MAPAPRDRVGWLRRSGPFGPRPWTHRFRRLRTMILHFAGRRLATIALAGTLVALLVPGTISAHAELVKPIPAIDSISTTPVTEVSGVFSEAMSADGSGLKVFDAAGDTVATGGLGLTADTRLVATPATPLGLGVYTVRWTAVATDGHVERGEWSFTVSAAPSSSASASAESSPEASPEASPEPSAAPSPEPSAVVSAPVSPASSGGSGASGSSASDLGPPIVIGLLILAAGAAHLLSRRNRPTDAA